MSKRRPAPAPQPAPPQGQTSSRRRRLVVASALAALAVAGGLVSLATDRSPAPVASAGGLPRAEFPEPGVVHVHGLGVDPADGQLYAATHSGLFRVPADGEAQRVANRYQDTMGFTVAGPGVLLGSGHPDPREDDVRPPLLGLVRSTDGGETWERLSLHGEADFHALQAAHGKVYGYDATSGTFMVSPSVDADDQDWERRSQLAVRDFAVSPTDPDVVLATTPQGLAQSTDGGRSWKVGRGAPPVLVLAWSRQDSLYGVDPEGGVHHSADGGLTWAVRGTAGGEPEAVTVDARDGAEVLYVAAAGKGVLASGDGGRTFTVRYREA